MDCVAGHLPIFNVSKVFRISDEPFPSLGLARDLAAASTVSSYHLSLRLTSIGHAIGSCHTCHCRYIFPPTTSKTQHEDSADPSVSRWTLSLPIWKHHLLGLMSTIKATVLQPSMPSMTYFMFFHWHGRDDK